MAPDNSGRRPWTSFELRDGDGDGFTLVLSNVETFEPLRTAAGPADMNILRFDDSKGSRGARS
jgi:hypothetical protein